MSPAQPSAKLDVYRDWLKIEAANRPLNYYQLLKLKMFEDDTVVIRKHYRELNAYIRRFATGDYIDQSQALLNELAKAMLCLSDHDRKEEYDQKLGRVTESAQTERTIEVILLQNNVVTREQIKQAKAYADAVGIELHKALIQKKAGKPEDIQLAYAESIGLPFVNLDDIPVDEYYAPQMDPDKARTHSFIPIMADMGKLILASPEPLSIDLEDELRLTFDMPVRCAICTTAQINAAIAKYYPRGAVQRLVPKSESTKSGVKKVSKRTDTQEEEDAPRKARVEKAPYTEAAKKNRVKVSAMAFCFTIMAVNIFRYLTVKNPRFFTEVLPYAFGAAIIAFAIAWFVSPRRVAEDDDEEDEDDD